jgi:hypothetical protein
MLRFLARRATLTARPLATSSAAFSTEVATMDEASQKKHHRWNETVTPWHSRPDLVPAEPNAVTAVSEAGTVGQLAGIPGELLKRKATIYRRARQATSSSSEKSKAWKIEFNHQHRWNNDLMGWQSGGDPAAQLYNLYFETPDQAAQYCRKHGFDFNIEQPNLPRDFHGKKSYAHNFLTEAVENKIKAKKPADIARNHFKWNAPRQTQWINQHRRSYGGEDHNPTGNSFQGEQKAVINDGECGPYGERQQ